MQKLGFIVSKRKILNIPEFIGVVNDINLVDDLNKPLLVVGLEEAKKIFGKVSLINRKINDNVMWTFNKTERRSDYENDLKVFCDKCINNAIQGIKYFYVNPVKLSFKNVKKLCSALNNMSKKYIYISGSMIYMYYENCIVGTNFDILEYCGIRRDRIVKKMILPNKSNVVRFNDSFLDSKIKASISNKKYIIPYFMSIY